MAITRWTIQEVTRMTGVTSRSLRHYGDVGLLPASEVGHGGVRHYDDAALVRLQRILLLRGLGLGLNAIAQVLASQQSEAEALATHLELLKVERATLNRRIAAVQRTLAARENGTAMTKDMFDGFDLAQYEEEVTRRWGHTAYESSNSWWENQSEDEKKDWQRQVSDLNAAWVAAASDGVSPDGERAQALAARHVAWLRAMPGTPAAGGDDAQLAAYLLGLGEMYVADDRFRANWSGDPVHAVEGGPEFVRDALRSYVSANLA